MKYVIGITGGISSGKSTFVSLLIQKGYTVFDSDLYVHSLYENQEVLHKLGEALELPWIYESPILDRKKLGKIIYSDSQKREALNQCIHPLVLEEIQRRIKENQGVLFLDIPLLFEAHFDIYCDKVIVVYVNPEIQIQRLMNRDSITKEEAILKINASMSLEEKKKQADYVLDNSGTREELEIQVNQLLKQMEVL